MVERDFLQEMFLSLLSQSYPMFFVILAEEHACSRLLASG
jgi:hypothetical protein